MSRTWRLLLWPLLVVAAVGASFAYLDMATAGLFSGKGLGQMAAYASEFFPPDLSAPHLRAIGRGLLETLAMSAIGTLLAALLGLLFALPAAGRFGVPAQSLARLLLNALRAVPELVWGALMVLAAGLGPNAGTLALALHTGGVLGRLFAEALENTPAQPAEALRLAGSGRLAAFAYGTLPGVWPQLVAYTLYRWENNIRMAHGRRPGRAQRPAGQPEEPRLCAGTGREPGDRGLPQERTGSRGVPLRQSRRCLRQQQRGRRQPQPRRDRRGPVRAGRSGQRSRGAGRRTAGISRRRPERRRLRAAATLSRLRHLHENCAAAFLHKQSISQEPPMNRFSLPRPDARQCVAGLGFSALLLLASSANAAACRDITSVQQSADATRNTSMGGHVTQHIYGMTPPSGSSQKDKTLFKSRGNYDAAWRQYGYIDNPVACSGNSKFQVVSLEKLHMGKIDAYSCKQADGQGVCTRWDTYMAKEISYGFVLKDGKWILNTLYPVPLD